MKFRRVNTNTERGAMWTARQRNAAVHIFTELITGCKEGEGAVAPASSSLLCKK